MPEGQKADTSCIQRNSAHLPTLVIIRGNSGSGKSSTAREVRRRYGRGCALLEQDYLRRIVLREHGSNSMPTVAPGLITTTARAALEAGYHVVLEGILNTIQYGAPLRELITAHREPSFAFWMDVSFDETVRRHERRPEPIPVTTEDMRAWYAPLDLLGVDGEQVIEESSGFDDTVATILRHSRLAEAAALTPCPLECPRCAEAATGSGATAMHRP
jgi:predicted kinase